MGWPTIDGIVDFFSDGVNEHGYFINVVRAADICIQGSSIKQQVLLTEKPKKADLCDISYDTFDCITDKIAEYCSSYDWNMLT